MDSSGKQCKWKPNKDKVSAFLNYLEEAKDVDGAEKFCQILKKLNCLDAKAHGSLIQTYLAVEQKKPSLSQRIKDDGVEISSKAEMLLERVCVTDYQG